MKQQGAVGEWMVQGQRMSAAFQARVEKCYGRVFNAVVSRIRGGYRGLLDRAQAEDIASEAVVYALGALARQPDPSGVTVAAWTALSMFKARHLANTRHRRHREGRLPELYVDAPFASGDDGTCSEAACVTEASLAGWHAAEQDTARAAAGTALYRNLDDLLHACGVTARAGDIFKAYYLERQPLDEVSRAFKASGNVVYVTTARVLRKLRAGGREAARDILACAA